MNWYIGQEIVCIKGRPKYGLIEGNIYTIIGLRESFCDCPKSIDIDVGITYHSDSKYEYCHFCGYKALNISDKVFFSEIRFVPLEYDKEAIEELLKQEITESILNNKSI